MDESPAGTPNPLNPVASSEPIISKPVAERTNGEQPKTSGAKPADAKPATQKSAQKKSKKPILATLIILILLAASAAVAAILILKPFTSHDAVPAAISKLFSQGVPMNTKVLGNVTVFDNNKDTVSLNNISMDFVAEFNARTGENIAEANVAVTLPAGAKALNFNISEMRANDGDLYLKLTGVAKFSELSAVFETINDEWIRIPNSDFSGIVSVTPTTYATCLIDAAGRLGDYGEDFVTLYDKNPFIEYSTADISIDKKNNPVYRLSFNPAKLAGFVNSLTGSGFANELMACTGQTATNKDVTEAKMAETIEKLPTIYVEINDNNDFTRVYLSNTDEDGLSGIVADISFEYNISPVKVEKPTYYIALGDFLEQLLSDFFNTDITK